MDYRADFVSVEAEVELDGAELFEKDESESEKKGEKMSKKPEYIERKQLLKLLNGWLKECQRDAEENGGEAELIAMGLSDAIDGVKDFPSANVFVLRWFKFSDHKPIAHKQVFVTLNNKVREIIEAYYDPNKNAWCYPHSFGTSVEGEVIAWAEKIRGYNGD